MDWIVGRIILARWPSVLGPLAKEKLAGPAQELEGEILRNRWDVFPVCIQGGNTHPSNQNRSDRSGLRSALAIGIALIDGVALVFGRGHILGAQLDGQIL